MASTLKAIPPEIFAQYVGFLGLTVNGDLGGYTVYTTKKGRVVWYPIAHPQEPPSAAQKKQRLRFRLAQANWSALTPTTQGQWELLVRKCSLSMTGQNLFISLSLVDQSDNFAAAQKHAGTTLTYPTLLPP